MELKRTLENDLMRWKDDPDRKPLIIRGARQVGKTSLARQIGNNHFSSLVEINLEKPEHLKIFGNVDSISDFEQKVQLYFQKPLIPGETLLFIDEIQASPALMTMLRFFAEEKPKLHVLAAGSLLEAVIGKGWSIPVGRVDYRFLYPLTFFEYLDAVGQVELHKVLRADVSKIDEAIHSMANKHFREYIIVGGLPEVVASFAKYHDLLKLKPIFDRLQLAYLDDVKKYTTSSSTASYLQAMINHGPKKAGELIAFENFMDLGFRSREMAEAANLVEKIMLLYQVQAVNSTTLPLTPKVKRSKKLLWLDVGLVNAVNDIYPNFASHEFMGHLMEQVVGQILLTTQTPNKKPNLYYWSRNRDEGSAEVDFFYQLHEKTVAVEVKSGKYYQMRSLMSLGSLSSSTTLVRTSFEAFQSEKWQEDGKTHQVLSIPFYLMERINQLIQTV